METDAHRIVYAKQHILPDYGIEESEYELAVRSDFDVVDEYGTGFDVGFAHSVFTHLPLNQIARCLHEVKRALKPNGVFYASFFPANDRIEIERTHVSSLEGEGEVTTSFVADPYHYHPSVFEWVCDWLGGLTVEHVGDYGHPRGQEMLAFRPSPDEGGSGEQ
jgi:SAM-dependent methyltransferase